MNETLEYLKSKYNLDFNTPSPIEIAGVGKLDLLRWIRELDFKIGAEIGVMKGEFSLENVYANPQLHLFGIDPWAAYEGFTDYGDQTQMNRIYDEMMNRMQPFVRRGRYEVIRKASLEALDDFQDNSLDFVFIDANHKAPYVGQDIEGWSKKVRPGGIVAGHDYVRSRSNNNNVIAAIHEYTRKNGINPWFLLGLGDEIPRVVRDDVRSWAFVRQ